MPLGVGRIHQMGDQRRRRTAAAQLARGEDGADAEHAADPAVDPGRQVEALGAGQHPLAVEQHHALAVRAPHGVFSCAVQNFA